MVVKEQASLYCVFVQCRVLSLFLHVFLFSTGTGEILGTGIFYMRRIGYIIINYFTQVCLAVKAVRHGSLLQFFCILVT